MVSVIWQKPLNRLIVSSKNYDETFTNRTIRPAETKKTRQVTGQNFPDFIALHFSVLLLESLTAKAGYRLEHGAENTRSLSWFRAQG